MAPKRTNKELLVKGLRQLLICFFLMFTGPTLVYIALSNKEKPLYIPILILAGVLCLGAMYMLYRGISTIMDSLFGKK